MHEGPRLIHRPEDWSFNSKGISLGLGYPVSVPSPDVFAYGHEKFEGKVMAVIDAKKDSFYTAVYRHGERKTDYLDIRAELIPSLAEGNDPVLVTGPHSNQFFDRLSDRIDKDKFILYPGSQMGTAFQLISCGIKKFSIDGRDPDNEGPLYIRKSEAELAG